MDDTRIDVVHTPRVGALAFALVLLESVVRAGGQLDTTVDTELSVHATDVRLDRPDTDAEVLRDLRHGGAVDAQPCDLNLTGREAQELDT